MLVLVGTNFVPSGTYFCIFIELKIEWIFKINELKIENWKKLNFAYWKLENFPKTNIEKWKIFHFTKLYKIKIIFLRSFSKNHLLYQEQETTNKIKMV